MLDFTKQISLDDKSYRLYRKLQLLLYLAAFLSAVYFAYLILFPSAYFTFNFSSPNSLKNTVIDPRDSAGEYANHGAVPLGQKMIFDAALVGNYEKAKIELVLDRQSDSPEDLEISARKSFQSFFYPESAPLEAKTGEAYKINGDYYLLSDGKLKKFISQNAYLTQFGEDQAKSEDVSFLDKYPLDENMVGYADGTLISYGISAYIVSSGKILPINNVVTFSAMGYNWNDVKPASADEISFYEKDKLFTISSAHPNGTAFAASDTGKSYLVENGTLRPVSNSEILKSWQKSRPVAVTEKSLDTKEACTLSKKTLSFRTYSCDLPLEKFADLIGKDYEFYLDSDRDIKIDNISITFKKQTDWNNLKLTLADLFNKFKNNYGLAAE